MNDWGRMTLYVLVGVILRAALPYANFFFRAVYGITFPLHAVLFSKWLRKVFTPDGGGALMKWFTPDGKGWWTKKSRLF